MFILSKNNTIVANIYLTELSEQYDDDQIQEYLDGAFEKLRENVTKWLKRPPRETSR